MEHCRKMIVIPAEAYNKPAEVTVIKPNLKLISNIILNLARSDCLDQNDKVIFNGISIGNLNNVLDILMSDSKDYSDEMLQLLFHSKISPDVILNKQIKAKLQKMYSELQLPKEFPVYKKNIELNDSVKIKHFEEKKETEQNQHEENEENTRMENVKKRKVNEKMKNNPKIKPIKAYPLRSKTKTTQKTKNFNWEDLMTDDED